MRAYVVTAVVMAVVILLALAVLLFARHVRKGGPVRWVQNGQHDQWTAQTAVGQACVTRVFDEDRGWDWEIEMAYDRRYSGREFLHYGNASLRIAQRRVEQLVEDRLQGREITGEDARKALGA
jgi:hypothetical protein